MNILILGSGGREHAIAWAVAQNPRCDALFCAPGNAGMYEVATCVALDPCDDTAVLTFAQEENIDFVIIGPEAPLAAGVANTLRAAGILTFGPTQAAAQLEASKAFTKAICDAAGAPTAAYGHFKEVRTALAYVHETGAPIVVKADGLAAGKGVTVAMTLQEAVSAIEDCFSGAYGSAGAEVVIEEFMGGEEASLFVLADGEVALPLASAQDHKRVGDGDTGPNTGGMGAYSPAPILSDDIRDRAMEEIIRPTLREMARRGTPYQGVLYAGLMIENGVPRLVEYNVRFGDPEAQVLALRLGAQLLDALLATADGSLDQMMLNWAEDHAITIVMAAKGYPGAYEKGSIIRGLEAIDGPDTRIFHAGTALENGQVIATGGRVLNITARGATLQEARDRAYAATEAIDWPDGFYRKDIGWRALT